MVRLEDAMKLIQIVVHNIIVYKVKLTLKTQSSNETDEPSCG